MTLYLVECLLEMVYIAEYMQMMGTGSCGSAEFDHNLSVKGRQEQHQQHHPLLPIGYHTGSLWCRNKMQPVLLCHSLEHGYTC